MAIVPQQYCLCTDSYIRGKVPPYPTYIITDRSAPLYMHRYTYMPTSHGQGRDARSVAGI